MERFFKRKAPDSRPDDINWEEEIKYDLGLNKKIDAYHPNQRESVCVGVLNKHRLVNL